MLVVKNNVVVGYCFILIPNENDIDVPLSMVNQFNRKTGFKLGGSSKLYAANIDNLLISISREADASIGGDRIVIREINTPPKE